MPFFRTPPRTEEKRTHVWPPHARLPTFARSIPTKQTYKRHEQTTKKLHPGGGTGRLPGVDRTPRPRNDPPTPAPTLPPAGRQPDAARRPTGLLADTTGQALSPALTCLHGLLPGTDGTASFEIRLGLKGDASVRQYDDRIPDRPEGYYLRTAPDGIVLAAADARGAFYAVQTLAQMTAHGKVAAGEVTDYPDIPFRGIVEGFYGTPLEPRSPVGAD